MNIRYQRTVIVLVVGILFLMYALWENIALAAPLADLPTKTPTPTIIPSWTSAPGAKIITLKMNGKGDYPDLNTAVEAVDDEAVIILESGTYPLKKILLINKNITLIGAGIDKTIITGDSLKYLILVEGPKRFRSQFITYKVQGLKKLHGVYAVDSHVNIQECRFTGANLETEDTSGTGLWLKHTDVTIQHSIFDNNIYGIWTSNGYVTVTDSEFTGNTTGIGIAGDDSKSVTISYSSISNNKTGVYHSGSPTLILDDNSITNNKEWGIRLLGTGKIKVIKNTVSSNNVGMLITGEAIPDLEENILEKNRRAGIYYWNNARGTARRNIISEAKIGIIIGQNAKPVLEENTVKNNRDYGLFYDDDSAGKASGNRCISNGTGIRLESVASPRLEKNICSSNKQYGIVIARRSKPVVVQNQCNENKKAGILVRDYAEPELHQNECSKNWDGIRFEDETGGKAVQNICKENRVGLVVVKPANPELVDNIVSGNTKVDLDDPRMAAATSTAAALAKMGPTATPIPSASPSKGTALPGIISISLKRDGSGDFPDLPSAIQAAADNAVITLDSGEFSLEDPIIIQKPVTLIGAGMDKTFIKGKGKDYVLRFTYAGTFKAKDITFKHEGDSPANVVEVETGQVDIQECRFTGAVAGPEMKGCFVRYAAMDIRKCHFIKGQGSGAGLVLGDGKVSGQVRDSEGINNGYANIVSYGDAAVTLERNSIRYANIGVSLWDATTATLKYNTITDNSAFGIMIGGKAKPMIEENDISNNEYAGISLLDDAAGTIKKNTMTNNSYGFYIGGNAQVTIEENVISGFGLTNASIFFYDAAGGIVRNNIFKGYWQSVNLRGYASPTIEENKCINPKYYGLLFQGKSSGVARNNQCKVTKYSSRTLEQHDNSGNITEFATPTALAAKTDLLLEDFSSGQLDEMIWNLDKGTWKVIESGGKKILDGTGPENYPQIWVKTLESERWQDYAFETNLQLLKGSVFVCLRHTDKNFYNVFLPSDGAVSVNKWIDGEYETVKETNYVIKPNTWYKVRLEIIESHLQVYIDNHLVTEYTFSGPDKINRGRVGYYIGGGDHLQIAEIKIWTINEFE